MLALLLAAATLTPFNPAQIQGLKESVGVQLIDDQSARWKLPPPKSETVYCGWVNSKNRMGAYTGWTPFMVFYLVVDKKTTKFLGPGTIISPENSLSIGAAKMCAENGYDLSFPPPGPDS